MEKVKTEMRVAMEKERRKKLRLEKPLVYEKIINYAEKEKRGEPTPIIDFSYDYACNMKCAHCGNACFAPKETVLSLDTVRDISRQADELGLAQFSVSGGEPTFFTNLDDIIEALDPQKFHIALNTNGTLLTLEKCRHLKEVGVDKVKISLDSINEDVYNQTRQQAGSYQKAVQAITNAQLAGLQAASQTMISHQTCCSKDTEQLAQFAHEHGINLDILVARAVGRWEGKEDVLITPEDAEYLVKLRNQYPEVQRDVFPTYGKCGGCGAVKRLIHITKYGDVLPCSLIHIAIGNIFEESLKDILDRGLRIKWFHDFYPVCLSGEARNFIRKYMSKFYGKPLPITWRDAFTKEDFIDGKMR